MHIYMKNACAQSHKAAPMFRLSMGASLPGSRGGLLQNPARGRHQRDSRLACRTDAHHLKLRNIIHIYMKNACAQSHKAAPMFRLSMGASLPGSRGGLLQNPARG